MNIQIICFKRGNTFEAQVAYTDENGVPVNLDTEGITVTSQVRTEAGTLVADLVVTPSDQGVSPGEYTLYKADTDTAAWPLEQLRWDIKYSAAGVVISTETIRINVQEEATH